MTRRLLLPSQPAGHANSPTKGWSFVNKELRILTFWLIFFIAVGSVIGASFDLNGPGAFFLGALSVIVGGLVAFYRIDKVAPWDDSDDMDY